MGKLLNEFRLWPAPGRPCDPYGGEEFALLLPGATLAARIVAERCGTRRRAVHRHKGFADRQVAFKIGRCRAVAAGARRPKG